MQRTRLNTLVTSVVEQLELLFINPWRRIALSLISILMGFFMGSAIVTTAGQDAVWDVPAAAILFAFIELISRFVYGYRSKSIIKVRFPLWLNTLNLFKIGVTYSLFLEAFKLGS
ncbi:Ycf20-like protein [Hyella patelloides LEGE 07179]|uniref:Ycf20-like protein n=1 Tax=Hyella patelloides LEGE 07179 TaxID=945734 RepID=A0A563VJC4_9CYAN|nr:DUF565 domain-containing protein [Hyella patelloides]VEP11512.1 Ycf20-like protein [Hyella patelloides LEGE 07179]